MQERPNWTQSHLPKDKAWTPKLTQTVEYSSPWQLKKVSPSVTEQQMATKKDNLPLQISPTEAEA